MAIAYVAGSTPQQLGGIDSPLAVNLPAGHASGHLLLLFLLSDDKVGTTSTPTGWTKMTEEVPAGSGGFLARARTEVFYRIDTGSLGSTVSVSFSKSTWPDGDASVLAWTAAYSGCDTTGPIERWDAFTDQGVTATQSHPVETTLANGDWLMTVRTAYSATNRTFTITPGTDTERVDTRFDMMHLAVYDTNAGLAPGAQTVRLTTASGTCSGGSVMLSVVLKPAAAASAVFASAGTATMQMTALDATTQEASGTWELCAGDGLPTYRFEVDWDGDGTFEGGLEDVTDKIISDVSISYGRDQDRQLSLASVGSSGFRLINVDRYLSPDFSSSPLYGDTEPARRVRGQVTYGATTYPLFSGRIDDYDIKADFADRSASFTLLDGLSVLQGQTLSTGVYKSMRTGELIGIILDLVGWNGGRDLDLGATIVPYWWVEDVDAFQAINDLVRSEGPPALAYQAPDGTFVFRDRHHRLLRQQSAYVQADFGGPLLGECDAADVSGYNFTPPFTYAHGWRDIVNSVTFEVAERGQSASLEPVWSSDDQLPIAIGQSVMLEVSATDPFTDAVAPVQGTDYDLTGSGVLNVTLSRTSGQSVILTLLAVGGSVSISNLQLRAKPIFTRRNIKVSREDADSITRHGRKSYPESAPWANANDADAIAGMILLHYAQRRPTVQLRITSADPQHFIQVVQRAVSDRIHIRYDEMGLDDDFFVEKVTHSLTRFNQEGKPPVHSVTLGCERNVVSNLNPFTFDLRGAGFDEGVFDPIQMDQPDTVFRFDDDVQGRFDIGLYGT